MMTTPELRRIFRWVRPLAVISVVVAVFALTTTPSSADDSTTTTTTLPAAPAGFADTLVSVYQSEYNTAQSLGQVQNLMTVGQYQVQIDGLNPQELAAFYYATQQVPEWSQLPALMQTIAAGEPSSANLSAFTTGAPTPVKAGGRPPVDAVLDAVDLPSTSPASATLVGSVGPYQAQTCPSGPSDAAVFAAQIAIDVTYAVYNIFSSSGLTSLFIIGIVYAFIAVAAAAAELVVQIIHDVLAYQQLPAQECQSNNQAGYTANIDNTTVASYGLIGELAPMVAGIQTTDATTQQDVLNIQSELTTLGQTVETTLTNDTAAIQSTVASDTQGTSTELQTIQSALGQDVTNIEAAQTTVGQQEKAEADKDSSAVQASLAVALSQILHETDTDAQGLNTVITQGNQQILNLVNSDFSTAQQQFEESLKETIEQGLANFGPVVPDVHLILPVQYGGFLNSTPVGVQEVVTSDLAAIQATGVKVKAAAVTDLAAANAALAASKWTTAWTDYAEAYQALA